MKPLCFLICSMGLRIRPRYRSPTQRTPVLWNLCCLLEKQLVELFMPDFNERLELAKRNLLAE